MWYLTSRCDLNDTVPPKGPLYLQFEKDNRPWRERHSTLVSTCCAAKEGAL